jgi:hypothetical protein
MMSEFPLFAPAAANGAVLIFLNFFCNFPIGIFGAVKPQNYCQ